MNGSFLKSCVIKVQDESTLIPQTFGGCSFELYELGDYS